MERELAGIVVLIMTAWFMIQWELIELVHEIRAIENKIDKQYKETLSTDEILISYICGINKILEEKENETD
jgi:hypothetical protein